MSYKLSEQEFKNVIKSSKEKRFKNFIGIAVGFCQYYVHFDYSNKDIKLYPLEEYAKYFTDKDYTFYNHRDLVGKILKNEKFLEYKINVFPTKEEDGLIFTVNEFYKIIKEERKSY